MSDPTTRDDCGRAILTARDNFLAADLADEVKLAGKFYDEMDHLVEIYPRLPEQRR